MVKNLEAEQLELIWLMKNLNDILLLYIYLLSIYI